MKRTIRLSVFETNSSSVHSFVMCTEEEYRRFEAGELVVNEYNPLGEQLIELGSGRGRTFDEYWAASAEFGYETFEGCVNGVVAFGYYGVDC